MPTIRKITDYGVLAVTVQATELVSLVDGGAFKGSIIAVTPSGEEIAMPVASSTPTSGNAQIITIEANFDLTSRTDWEQGVFEIYATTAVRNTSGVAIAGRVKLQDVRVEIVNPLRPTATLQNLEPITAPATSYTFDAVFTDDGTVNAASITTNNILITGPNGFSKEPDALISKTPNTDAATITVRYRVDGAFNAANNGTYLVEALPGAFVDNGGRGNAREPIGTIGVAIADDTPTTGTTTSFAGLSALPTGWESKNDEVNWLPEASASFIPEGVLIPDEGANNFYGNWVRSPIIPFTDGAEVQVDLLLAAYDSQLGAAGEKRDFNVTNQSKWNSDGLLWRDDGDPQRKPMRMRFAVSGGNLTTTYAHDLGGGFAKFYESTAPWNPNVPEDEMRIYVDGASEEIIITGVTVK